MPSPWSYHNATAESRTSPRSRSPPGNRMQANDFFDDNSQLTLRNESGILALAVVRFAAVAAKFGTLGVAYAGSPVAHRTAHHLQRIGSGSPFPQLRGRLIETVPCQR